MSIDTDRGEGEMTKINVRVPAALLEEIDEIWEKRGYANKSEFIRDALRDAVNPNPRLSDEVLEHLAVSGDQKERGETISHEEVKERFGPDE